MTIFNNVMRLMHKILFNLGILVAVLILFYAFYLKNDASESSHHVIPNATASSAKYGSDSKTDSIKMTPQRNKEGNVNLWCIFTKVDRNSNLKYKFEIFAKSALAKATKPIALNVITDNASRSVAEGVIDNVQNGERRFHHVTYLHVADLAEKLKRLVSIMSPHFSSRPGTYYSDALFFLSLGLHRIVSPKDLGEQKIIMTDVDIKFVGDITELWREFDKFNREAVVGLGPELSPVYRHVFHSYRASNPGTKIGEPLSENGYPGLNSGVILLNLERMRESTAYLMLTGDDESSDPSNYEEMQNSKNEANQNITSVDSLVKKYLFKGHLGDQDFYTLLGAEYPELIHILPCVWNRQLCTWWGNQGGYGDVFDKYFKCDGKIKIYHGNCNSPFPKDAE